MTRSKLKILKLQNMEIKNFQSSKEERQIAPLPLAKLHTKVFEDPQNENFGTSK
jgi:hypothetical protein